jgi:hypothetical protein
MVLQPRRASCGRSPPASGPADRGSGHRCAAPQGRYGYIDSPEVFDANPFKWKCISIHLEAVFMRSLMQTVDMSVQGDILRQVAELIEAGKIKTTLTETFGTINAANLKRAHQLLESGRARGKNRAGRVLIAGGLSTRPNGRTARGQQLVARVVPARSRPSPVGSPFRNRCLK